MPEFVEILLAGVPARLQRYLVKPNARVRILTVRDRRIVEESDPAFARLAVEGLGFRPQSLRLSLNEQSQVEEIDSYAWIWTGVLVSVGRASVTIRGWAEAARSDSPYELQSMQASHYSDPTAQVLRVATTRATVFTVNLDPVPRARLAREIGRVVEIVPDCRGRARFVDVLKVNRLYNFTEGHNAFYFDGVGSTEPPRLNRDTGGRWGFIEEDTPKSGAAPRRVQRAGTDVRVYDRYRFPRRIEDWVNTFVHAVAGAWVDPRTGLVTHVFWADTME